MSNYDVHEVFLDKIKFKALILSIPANEIEDILAFFAKDKGMISRLRYEDFVISTCVSNIKDLISVIDNKLRNKEEMYELREALLKEIYNVNQSLKPDNIVINKNSVLKVRKQRKKKEDVVLDKNDHWKSSNIQQVNRESKDKVKEKSTKKVRIDELEYTVTKKWWTRINRFVYIKKYNPDDAEVILERQFHNVTSFNTFIASLCIESFDEFFNEIDADGLPSKIPPYVLINELYGLCKECNPFLLYENAKVSSDNIDAPSPNSRQHGRLKKYVSDEVKGNSSKSTFNQISRDRLNRLKDSINVFVIGQDKAVESISNAVTRASVGLRNPERPIGSFLFAGRTGVGKTLLAKTLANELIDHKGNLVRIDCSEYSADHEYSKLIGAPNGYYGYEEGGILTNAVARNPFCVVLLDEIEKANSKVHNLLLQVLDDGILTDGKGNTVSFKDTIIIMTSNIGVEEINGIGKTIGFGDVAEVTEEKKNNALDKALKKGFKPELLNRIDEIVYFNTLQKKDYMRIIDIELFKLTEFMQANDTVYKTVKLNFSDKIRSFVYKNGIDDEYGARHLSRYIYKSIATPLAAELLKEDPLTVSKGIAVDIDANRGNVSFKVNNLNDKGILLASK